MQIARAISYLEFNQLMYMSSLKWSIMAVFSLFEGKFRDMIARYFTQKFMH